MMREPLETAGLWGIGTVAKQRGSGFIEVLVALAIMGAIGVVFLNAIASGSLGAAKIDERSTAESLVRTQMEYIRSLPYDDSNYYPVTSFSPSGYTPVIEVTDISPPDYPDTIQKVVIKVFRDGRPILAVENFKVKR